MTMAAKRLRDRSDNDIMRGVDEVDTCGTSITLGLFRLLTGQKKNSSYSLKSSPSTWKACRENDEEYS